MGAQRVSVTGTVESDSDIGVVHSVSSGAGIYLIPCASRKAGGPSSTPGITVAGAPISDEMDGIFWTKSIVLL